MQVARSYMVYLLPDLDRVLLGADVVMLREKPNVPVNQKITFGPFLACSAFPGPKHAFLHFSGCVVMCSQSHAETQNVCQLLKKFSPLDMYSGLEQQNDRCIQ